MLCENRFCIYEKDGCCKLDFVELDIQGMCKDCIYPDLDVKTLENLKKQTLNTIEKPL